MAKMVDRVMGAMKNPDRIRNIAICAHIDHGKTTFSDNLLSGAGMMSEELAGKARMMDIIQNRTTTLGSAQPFFSKWRTLIWILFSKWLGPIGFPFPQWSSLSLFVSEL